MSAKICTGILCTQVVVNRAVTSKLSTALETLRLLHAHNKELEGKEGEDLG